MEYTEYNKLQLGKYEWITIKIVKIMIYIGNTHDIPLTY